MLVRCREVMKGPGPSEVVIELNTSKGPEEVIVYNNSVVDGNLEIGQVIGAQKGYSLVELPRETSSGLWRVWVQDQDVLELA